MRSIPAQRGTSLARQVVTRSDLAYCLDALIPGLYLWAGRHVIAIGGCAAEPGYPGMVRSPWGCAVVLGRWSSYRGGFD